MSKQDERQRLRRRLQEHAIDLAINHHWEEAIDINTKMLRLGEDPETYNRLGKAHLELGNYRAAHDSYQETLRLNPTNSIARRNLARLEALLERGIEQVSVIRSNRQQVDLRLFITETGKTAITTLIDVPRSPVVDSLVTGEKMELQLTETSVIVTDADGHVIGRIEPKLSQRLAELIRGGNRYIVAVAHVDARQLRILIRETYQDPTQRGRISFPGKLGEGAFYVSTMRFDEFADELLDEEEVVEEVESADEEEYIGGEEEELGLDEIEQDMSDDDGNEE